MSNFVWLTRDSAAQGADDHVATIAPVHACPEAQALRRFHEAFGVPMSIIAMSENRE
jgi:hypothetical protein